MEAGGTRSYVVSYVIDVYQKYAGSVPTLRFATGRFTGMKVSDLAAMVRMLSFAIITSASRRLTWNELGTNNRTYMPALLLSIFRVVRLLLSGHQAIAIENAALRLQLAAFQRKRKRPVLTTFDRVFWITLRRCGPAGAGRYSMSRPTPSPAGSENGFVDSGRGYRNVMAVGEAGPLQPSSFAG
jgi:hypothetical protein